MSCARSKNTRHENNNSNNSLGNDHFKYTRNHKIRYEQNVPHQYASNLMPVNAGEQKDRFLRRNITPEFHLKVIPGELESAILHDSGHITFTLFREATRILDTVCRKFKSIDNFVEQSFGPRISVEEATQKITEYIKEANLPTNLEVIWCEDLIGSALMCSTGIDKNGNIPRHRKFTMLLKTNEENTYLRERGIMCLMDHELGTHYHRSFNEGLQPWYGKRDIYGLGPTNSCEAVKIEEGLACLHTVLRSEYRYLGVPALLYYGSCMAEYLPFKELFEHLGKYVSNEEQRWKHCMRIKRCLPSQDKCGGYGKDQRYFEGAVKILRNQANVDFNLLMAGKLTLEETNKVRRCAIMSAVRLPLFMQDKEKYLASLRTIARLNGIKILEQNQVSKAPSSVCSRSSAPVKLSPLSSTSSFLTHKPINQSSASRTSLGEKKDDKKCDKPSIPYNRSSNMQTPSEKIQLSPASTELSANLSKLIKSSKKKQDPEEAISPTKLNGGTSLHSRMKGRLLKSLDRFENTRNEFSNALTFIGNKDCAEKSKKHKYRLLSRSSHSSTALSKQSTDNNQPIHNNNGGVDNFENGIKFLPKGVCGCQLFTHGSFKFPVENTVVVTDENPNCTASTANGIDEEKNGMDNNPNCLNNIRVPVVLEIDLRHPVVGL
ncbi:unnamed protein product [Trichobilharzia szidati]|nr:unnamed protein product [Trichobilharzia szidati]